MSSVAAARRAAVNAPLILPETLRQLEPWMALVEKLGRLYTQLHPGALKRVEFSVAGEIAQFDTRPLTTALIKGAAGASLRGACQSGERAGGGARVGAGSDGESFHHP